MYPFFHIFGRDFSAYGVMAVIGIIATVIYSVIRCRQKKIDWNDQLYYLTFAFIFLFIGATLLFHLVGIGDLLSLLPYLFTDFEYFKSRFAMGMVFYGGLYGALVGCMVYSKIFKQDTREMFMYTIPVIPLFHMFGRIGCFLGGCCYGMESERFGIAYTNAASGANGVPYLPIQLYEAVGELIIFIVLCINQRKVKKYYQPIGIYFVSYGIMRFVLEFFRGDVVRGFMGFLSTSQWISLITIPLGIYCLCVPTEKNFFNKWFTAKAKKSV